jgi:diadenylate cyclase
MTEIIRSWWVDILDIVIVWYLFYQLFRLIRGTRAAQMFLGLAIIILASFIADWLGLSALTWIIESLRTVWVVAFVILFQPELRRVLAQLGQSRFVRYFMRPQHLVVLDEVVRAARDLSQKKTGALIAIARDASLRSYIDTGTKIGARVTSELIITIFAPNTPLHDGACIIVREHLVAAGCILPISENPMLPVAIGMRHRAAVGLTEETDAVVVIVSEETGRIAVSERGNLRRNLEADTLRDALEDIFAPANHA